VWAAADHAVGAGRPQDAVTIFAAGILAIEGSSHLPEMISRMRTLRQDHGNDLTVDSSTILAGTLVQALMNAAEFAEMSQVLAEATSPALDAEPASRAFIVSPWTLLAHASGHYELVEGMLDTVADVPGIHQVELLYRALKCAMQRRYEEANSEVVGYFRPEPAFQYDKVAVFHLWLAHLLGRTPSPEIVDYAKALTLDDSVYAMSASVTVTMSTAASSSEAGRSLTHTADAMLTGRMQLEEAEFLVAFARLAHVSGDAERAQFLANMVAPRSPWTWIVLGEILGDLGRWPQDEWADRTRTEVLLRSNPEPLAELRDRAPGVLADELDRWRR
jgi:hypothetical protein